MSSEDEDYHDFDYPDEDEDEEMEMDDEGMFRDPEEVVAGQGSRVQGPAPVRHFQPPPRPMPDMFSRFDAFANRAAAGGPGFGLNPNAFQPGFGGHAFARPPASAFRRQYRAFSTAILESQQGRSFGGGRSNLMYGGKIVMPPSALDELTQMDIELPITFELTNPVFPDTKTHVGVLEFIAEEGKVHLPQWVMDQLRLDEGDPVRILGGRYPKGKLIKIQPQSVDFLEISDPKAVLEQALRNFSCLTAGDIIEIGYHSLTFRLLIMEISPEGPAISVLDTDLEVDFAPPLGYVEPERKPAPSASSMKERYVIDTSGKQEVDAKGSGTNTPVAGPSGRSTPSVAGASTPGGPGSAFEAFRGSGQSLTGKRVNRTSLSKRKEIEPMSKDSKVSRTDTPRIVTADTQLGTRQVPAALNLPFGSLFFGFENLGPPPGSREDEERKEQERQREAGTTVPFANLSGPGQSLSGKARSSNSSAGPAPAGTSSSTANALPRSPGPTTATPSVPFSGSGNTLGASGPNSRSSKKTKNKGIEVIEIDSD